MPLLIIQKRFITTAKQSDEEKQRKLTESKNEEAKIINKINETETVAETKAIEQEIDELLFYVKQRIFLRFNDIFNESFNPSSLRDDGRDMKKALQSCLDEMIQFIGFDLSQEMRATSLRVEKFINQTVQTTFKKISDSTNEINEHIQYLSFENKSFETLEFEPGLDDLNEKTIKSVFALFKNAKAFFEQGGKEKMRESLYEQMQDPVDLYIKNQKERIQQYYLDQFNGEMNRVKESMTNEVVEYYKGIYAALSEKIDIDVIENTKKQIEKFL